MTISKPGMSSHRSYGGTSQSQSQSQNSDPSPSTPRVQHLRTEHSSNHLRPQSRSGSGAWSDDETEEDEEPTPLVFEIEPGIDPRREDFSDLYNSTLGITVADWSADKAKIRQDITHESFLRWIDRPRPTWSKARWISLNGLHWDVFKAIALKYELQ